MDVIVVLLVLAISIIIMYHGYRIKRLEILLEEMNFKEEGENGKYGNC